MKAFFRMLTAAFKRESGATGLGSAFLLAFVIYTGYTIPEPTMVAALEWIKYINVCHPLFFSDCYFRI